MALVSWSNPEILQQQQQQQQHQKKRGKKKIRVLNLQDFYQPDLKLHLPSTVQHPQSFFPVTTILETRSHTRRLLAKAKEMPS